MAPTLFSGLPLPKIQLNVDLSGLNALAGNLQKKAENAGSAISAQVQGAAAQVQSAAVQVQGAAARFEAKLPSPARDLIGGVRRLPTAAEPVLTHLEGAGLAAQGAVLGAMRQHIPAIICEALYIDAPKAVASEKVDPALVSTIPRTLAYRTAKTPDRVAFQFPGADGKMDSMTWKEVSARVKDISGGLRELGLSPGDSAAIFSPTRVEWVLADLAITATGGVTTAVMPNNKGEVLKHILNDSQAKVVFAENDAQLATLSALRAELPHVIAVVNLTGAGRTEDGWVVGPKDLEARGKERNRENPGEYEAGAEAVKPEDLATLIYTSGTTGMPKGVELQHSAWSSQQEAAAQMGFLSDKDKQYLWLPFAHSFGKFLLSASIRLGLPTVIDGNPNNIVKGLQSEHPTFTSGVPRVFEKMLNGILDKSLALTGVKRQAFDWARGVGAEISRRHATGERPGVFLALQSALADALVFSKIRAQLGGEIAFLLSGGAPLSPEVAVDLDAMGLRVLQGYGLTETSGASHVNRPDCYDFASVGRPLPGVDVKLSADGEILLKGANLMRGYHNLPEATAKAFTEDGYLKTGDLGRIGPDGKLYVTGRAKDQFKLSTGEFVDPVKLESALVVRGGGVISNAVIHGASRPYYSAVIALDPKALRDRGLGGSTVPLNEDQAVRKLVRSLVDPKLKFFVAPTDFTVDGGELTGSMKVKRSEVEKRYKAQLDALYESGARA